MSETNGEKPRKAGHKARAARSADAAAEAYPEDATSMSVPPPSREAREASEAVGSPQATNQEAGPSPPNKTGAAPAPPTVPAWKSVGRSARSAASPPTQPSEKVAADHPAKETLKTLGPPAKPATNPEAKRLAKR